LYSHVNDDPRKMLGPLEDEISTQRTSVTDRQTDRQMNRTAIALQQKIVTIAAVL